MVNLSKQKENVEDQFIGSHLALILSSGSLALDLDITGSNDPSLTRKKYSSRASRRDNAHSHQFPAPSHDPQM